MKYLKSLIFAFKEIFIMFIFQYAVLIACIVCLGKDRSIVIGTILVCAVEILYVIFKLKNGKPAIGKHNLFPYALMGIGITTSYNMLLFAMGLGNNVMVDMNIFLNILASGIVGPIFEEILFRFSFVNSLKKFNSQKMVIFISSLVFAICHTGITTCIYAFIIGMVNAYLYLKKKDILIPIVINKYNSLKPSLIIFLLFNVIISLLHFHSFNFDLTIFRIISSILGFYIIKILKIKRKNEA